MLSLMLSLVLWQNIIREIIHSFIHAFIRSFVNPSSIIHPLWPLSITPNLRIGAQAHAQASLALVSLPALQTVECLAPPANNK